MEKLGDLWGRSIRYGGTPSDTGKHAIGTITRGQVMAVLMKISDDLESNSIAQLQDEDLAEQVKGLENMTTTPDAPGAELDVSSTLELVARLSGDISARQADREKKRQDTRKLLTSLTDDAEGW